MKNRSVEPSLYASPIRPKTRPQRILSKRAQQFDFSANWEQRIVPLLREPSVVDCLTIGMRLYDPAYKQGDPPYKLGEDLGERRRIKRGSLDWYRPYKLCHYIAPFCWALARLIFPELKWGFLCGSCHTVVVGCVNDVRRPAWIMDILLGEIFPASESPKLVTTKRCYFYPTIGSFIFFFSPVIKDSWIEIAHKVDESLGISGSTYSVRKSHHAR